MSKLLSLVACSLLTHPMELSAETGALYDRVQLNWDTMRIKFYGEARKSDSVQEAERMAVKEGISYIVEAIPAIRLATLEGGLVSKRSSADIAKKVSTKTYSQKTTYFSDGRVRVDLESSLPNALAPEGVDFAKDEPDEEMGHATGLQISLKAPMDPQIMFEVQDEDGDSLYRLKDVAKSEFSKNFMGRFFQSVDRSKIKYFIGAKPLKINGKLKGDRVIVVSSDAWESLLKDNYGILERAKVAVVSR